jgi:hypothetical protein
VADLITLDVADPPALWEAMGFVLEGDRAWVDGIGHQLGRPGTGVVGWTLHGVDPLDDVPTIVISEPAAAPASATRAHPNGVIGLDHVVISTPDLERTVSAFERSGLPLRRTRQAGTPEQPMTQAFCKVGPVVIEIVGLPEAALGAARFWGLTYTVSDLDATADLLGAHLRPIRDAVQPGRRIATLDRSFGSTVPIAFMSARD